MSLPAREKAISTFADSSEVNILVASLRCGGRKFLISTGPKSYR
jgi:hypothetical protein